LRCGVITGAQCLAARELLGWSRARLAKVAKVSHTAIRKFDVAGHEPAMEPVYALMRIFVNAGVIFIDENGEGPGVRLRKGKP
jgi:ribosome-binding protein aMBF1 (putative translation factor)